MSVYNIQCKHHTTQFSLPPFVARLSPSSRRPLGWSILLNLLPPPSPQCSRSPARVAQRVGSPTVETKEAAKIKGLL